MLDEYVVPYLKQNNYGKGLLNGMLAVGQVIARNTGVTLGDGYVPVKSFFYYQEGAAGLFRF